MVEESVSRASRGRDRERELRSRLGIPEDARRVIVFAESSHWDPNWIRTSEEYFLKWVRPNLDSALDELAREPRRIYGVECIFFLRMYWDRSPERRDEIRDLVNEGRLRLTSSGVTTADTMLPRTESLLRDFLIGQEWLRKNGMNQEPSVAYFPDSFGHAPTLPSLLKAASFDQAVVTRIDGMFFPGDEYALKRRFPRAESSAERLWKQERSLDFVWRDVNGSEVLCHWNAFTYGQGDLLAHHGIIRVYNLPFAFEDRSERNVARRIRQYAAQLGPISRTPYLLCPIGMDFVRPIRGLVSLLDRYNAKHASETGIWAVNAGPDDYLNLVDAHRADLPVLEFDPNPYWTGFYTSRPALKRRCHELVDLLSLAEKGSLLPENQSVGQEAEASLDEAWWDAVVSNHHDFITGTAPDRVVLKEQLPWLERSTAQVNRALVDLVRSVSKPKVPVAARRLPEWERKGERLSVKADHFGIEFSERAGGAIVRAWHPESGASLLTGFSNDLVVHRDTGGLWRMGHEYFGGKLRETERGSQQRARLEVRETEEGLEIASLVSCGGERIRRLAWIRADSPLIWFRVEGCAPERHTITVRFETGVAAKRLSMDAVGGVVERPLKRIYEPTFWPLRRFVHWSDDERGIAFLQRDPGALTCQESGGFEAIAIRNATRERAFGLLPLPGMVASGREWTPHAFDYAISFTDAGDWRENAIAELANSMADSPWEDSAWESLRDATMDAVEVVPAEVEVSALKRASRGSGVILRLISMRPITEAVEVGFRDLSPKAAQLCDARERDLEPLEIRDGKLRLEMPGTIATIRLIL